MNPDSLNSSVNNVVCFRRREFEDAPIWRPRWSGHRRDDPVLAHVLEDRLEHVFGDDAGLETGFASLAAN
jgi:hypothetical protein